MREKGTNEKLTRSVLGIYLGGGTGNGVFLEESAETSLLAFLEPLSPVTRNVSSSDSAPPSASRLSKASKPAKPRTSSKPQPQLSPRSEAVREKSREAVRRCRQRKREQEDGLRRQVAELEAENAKMKVPFPPTPFCFLKQH